MPKLPGSDLLRPNAMQMLAYWMRCSQGNFDHEWAIPPNGTSPLSSAARCHDGPVNGLELKEVMWQPSTGALFPGVDRAVNRQVRPMVQGSSGDDAAKSVRFAQVAQTLDYKERKKQAKTAPTGLWREFHDREVGGLRRIALVGEPVDVAPVRFPTPEFEEAASVCEAGSLAGDEGVRPSARPAYISLGSHFIDIRGPTPADNSEDQDLGAPGPSSPPRPSDRPVYPSGSHRATATPTSCTFNLDDRSASESTKATTPFNGEATPGPEPRILRKLPRRFTASSSATPGILNMTGKPRNSRGKSVAFEGVDDESMAVDDDHYGVAGPSYRGASIPPPRDDEPFETHSSPIRKSNRNIISPNRLTYPVASPATKRRASSGPFEVAGQSDAKRRRTVQAWERRSVVPEGEDDDDDEDDRATPVPSRRKRPATRGASRIPGGR